MNLKLPEVGDTVLYEGEQYTIITCDHENLIYEIDNDNYVGFALLSELTLKEDVSTNTELSESELSESEPEQATAYIEPKNGDTLLS